MPHLKKCVLDSIAELDKRKMTYFAGNVTKIEFTRDFRDTRKLRKNKQVIKTGIPFLNPFP